MSMIIKKTIIFEDKVMYSVGHYNDSNESESIKDFSELKYAIRLLNLINGGYAIGFLNSLLRKK